MIKFINTTWLRKIKPIMLHVFNKQCWNNCLTFLKMKIKVIFTSLYQNISYESKITMLRKETIEVLH